MCQMHGQGGVNREQEERIRQRAGQFVERWKKRHDVTECRESQTFINEFFGIFDVDRFASGIRFEYNIYQNGNRRRIDVFWRDVILIENKTAGEDLNRASKQVRTYLDMLRRNLPRYVLINNFRIFKIYQVQRENRRPTMSECASFSIEKLPEEIHRFYYFLEHKHEKLVERSIEIEKIVYKIKYGTLILASSLSLTFGYIISDGQPRAFLERLIKETGTIQDRSKAGPHLPPPTVPLEAGPFSRPSVSGTTQLPVP